MKILVVDDEKTIVKGIKFNLENDGYTVETAYDGEAALTMLRKTEYTVVVLDLMLPGIDGLEVCRQLREFSNVPVIMLTAKDGDTDKLIGFEYGADDYLTKPFNIMELRARIRALIRRSYAAQKDADNGGITVLECEDLTLEIETRRVEVSGKPVDLTIKEFDLLELLMKDPGKVFSRDKLLSLVWGEGYPGDIRTVDVHIRRVREKIEKDPANPIFVQTKWGVGYYFWDGRSIAE